MDPTGPGQTWTFLCPMKKNMLRTKENQPEAYPYPLTRICGTGIPDPGGQLTMDPSDQDPQHWVLVCLYLSFTLRITTDRDQPFFRRISQLMFFGDVIVKKKFKFSTAYYFSATFSV
jgi:hypothetical protein